MVHEVFGLLTSVCACDVGVRVSCSRTCRSFCQGQGVALQPLQGQEGVKAQEGLAQGEDRGGEAEATAQQEDAPYDGEAEEAVGG